MRLWTFQSKEAANMLLSGKDFVPDSKDPEVHVLGVVRCFCKLGDCKSLSLATFIKKYDYLARAYGLTSDSGVMLELEVPEDQILATNVAGGTTAVIGRHIEFMREQGCSLNTTTFLVKSEWVVAVRELSNNAFSKMCHTLYINEELIPAWKDDIMFEHGLPVEQVNGEYHYLSGVNRDIWLKDHCPNEAPYYYTKAESDDFCGLKGM